MGFHHDIRRAGGKVTYACAVTCDVCTLPMATGSDWRHEGHPNEAMESARRTAEQRAVAKVVTTGMGYAGETGNAVCRACANAQAARTAYARNATHGSESTAFAWGDPSLPDGLPHVVAVPTETGYRVLLRMRVAGILAELTSVVADAVRAHERATEWRDVAPACAAAVREAARTASAASLERARREGYKLTVVG